MCAFACVCMRVLVCVCFDVCVCKLMLLVCAYACVCLCVFLDGWVCSVHVQVHVYPLLDVLVEVLRDVHLEEVPVLYHVVHAFLPDLLVRLIRPVDLPCICTHRGKKVCLLLASNNLLAYKRHHDKAAPVD